MSASAADETTAVETDDLTAKQQRILGYLRANADDRTYFKSRLIAEDLGMTAKEVGANMPPIVDGDVAVDVERWGYSSGTTWMVTV